MMGIADMYQLENKTLSIPGGILIWEREGLLGTDVIKKEFMGEAGHEPGKEKCRADSSWSHPEVEESFI